MGDSDNNRRLSIGFAPTNLVELESMCKLARQHDAPDDAKVRLVEDRASLALTTVRRIAVSWEPSLIGVQVADLVTEADVAAANATAARYSASTMCPGCGQMRHIIGVKDNWHVFEPHHIGHNGVDGPLCTQRPPAPETISIKRPDDGEYTGPLLFGEPIKYCNQRDPHKPHAWQAGAGVGASQFGCLGVEKP